MRPRKPKGGSCKAGGATGAAALMAGAPPGADALSVLIASSNVATLSEDRVAQFPSWTSHLSALLFPSSSKPHDMIVLHLQEVGGVKWTAAKVQEFADRLQSAMLDAHVASDYWSTGLVIDMEATRFTALGTLVLIRRLSAARFRRRHFPSAEFVSIGDGEKAMRGLVAVAGHEYFRHEKFEGSTSRKGFLVSEWLADGQALSHVNVHLFHDDSNLLALDSTPSTYATKRSAALRVVMQRLPPGPALLAGDFNFRLDLAAFMAWLRARVPSLSSDTDGQYVLIQKDVFQCPYLDALLNDVANHTSIRQAYDKELHRFNQEADASLRLHEEAIEFPPTYPVESVGKWSTKRAPAWCDRVLYTRSCTALFSASHKRSYAALQATPTLPLGSDHLPVFFHFHVTPSVK